MNLELRGHAQYDTFCSIDVSWNPLNRAPLCRRAPATATAVAKEKFSTVMDASSRAVDYLGDDHKKAMSAEWRMLEPENKERTEDKKGPSNGPIVYVVILHLAGEGL